MPKKEKVFSSSSFIIIRDDNHPAAAAYKAECDAAAAKLPREYVLDYFNKLMAEKGLPPTTMEKLFS